MVRTLGSWRGDVFPIYWATCREASCTRWLGDICLAFAPRWVKFNCTSVWRCGWCGCTVIPNTGSQMTSQEWPTSEARKRDQLDFAKKLAKMDPATRDRLMTLERLRRNLPTDSVKSTQSSPRPSLTPEQEHQLLPVLAELLDAAVMEGKTGFGAAARQALADIEASLGKQTADVLTLAHLQGAYIAMSSRYPDGKGDDVMTVAQFKTKEQIMKQSDAKGRPQGLEPFDAGNLLGRVESEEDEVGSTSAKVGQAPSSPQTTATRPASAALIERLSNQMGRRQKLILAIAVMAIVVAPAWFFRFQPLPTIAIGAFINRWTGTVYFIDGSGRYRVAEPQDRDE